MVVEGWLARAATARPERVAVETPGRSCSYAELLELASAGAAELAARGAGRGTRIAIELPPGLAFAQALHASLLLGAVALPVDLRGSEAERRRTTAAAELRVTEPLPERSWRPPAQAGWHDLDATAVILHTSGTTAEPRPIELSYGNFLWSALGSSVALGHEPGERWLCTLPLCHVGGLSILLRSCIHATTAIVHERFETDRVLRSLREEGVTLVSLVATTLARLLDAGLARPASLRCALTGGGPVPAALVERARRTGVPVSLTYGLSEACSQVTTTPVAAIGSEGPLAAGPPLFCTRVQIAADGEILVRGPTVAPSAPAADGWLHTGDLGSVGADGGLRVLGRRAETIVSGGENVSPAEVEAVLEAHPQVLEAAVLGSPDERWGEAVTALVVAREGVELDEQQLRSHCAGALAPFKVPKRILAVSGPLPRTSSGKLLRRELR
ncbi:MAG TPA: AMP-binding protein [Solirubrobacteraceae bacterium]|jgi:O-succinylbenzoic acid--CoA ligase